MGINRFSMLEQTLQSLGFAEKEAKIYLTALARGGTTIQDLAEATAIPRATTYVQVSALLTRGFMHCFEKDGRTLYSAAPPERLLEHLDALREQAQQKTALARTLLPELLALQPDAKLPKVRLFEGLNGLQAMRDELLKHREVEWYSFSGFDQYRRAVPDEANRRAQVHELWKNANRCKAVISAHDVAPLTAPLKFLYERYQIPPDQFPTPGEVAIFANTIALISYEEKPTGVLIENAELATVMRSLFALAFERAKMYTRLDV